MTTSPVSIRSKFSRNFSKSRRGICGTSVEGSVSSFVFPVLPVLCVHRGISKLLKTGTAESFNSVPGYHSFQWFSKSLRNFTPVISHLWLNWRLVNFG